MTNYKIERSASLKESRPKSGFLLFKMAPKAERSDTADNPFTEDSII